jgi:signal transduction histidine kinase
MTHSETILVVDDEPLLRAIIHNCIKDMGCQVLEAEDGQEAMETCLRERPDLVLLDINMPGMNGFETCRCIKAHPDLGDTTVIYLSALTDTRDLVEGFASGAVDYVRKPFQSDEVRARVAAHLEIRRQRRQLEASRRDLDEAYRGSQAANRLLIEVNLRLQRSEALQSHFIAHMRSEINDPLSAILGLADQIADPRLPAEQGRALAARIRAEAFHLDFQLRNIFCAAELEAGEASPSITQVEVASVLRDTAEAFAGSALEKGQAIVVEAPSGLESCATDARMLRIILANLVANAIEFSPEGGRIKLKAHREGEHLRLDVTDEGVGIREADQAVIFERFRKLDEGLGRAHRGQGLGLAVVKALLELLDGEILVVSEPGRGSTFTCRLPLKPQSANPDTFAFDGNFFLFDEPTES